MLEILAIVIAVLVGLTLVVAILILLNLRRQSEAHLTHEHVARAMRDECDLVRRDAGEHARAARGELVQIFGALSQSVDGHVREFGGRLGEGMAAMNGRVDVMSAKLDRDIAQMGEDATRSRDVLRHAIDSRLETAAAAHSDHARALREEVGATMRGLNDRNVATLADMSHHQKERLEGTERALTGLSDRHTTTQDALRKTLDDQLTALRQENSAKLNEMRRTVDETLQTTLETRLGESFRSVLEQLARVYEGLGQMQSLTSSVGDLKSVLTNVKTRGIFGEVQLERLLEDLLAPQQFLKNVRVRPNSQERVEFAVRVPNRFGEEECLIPIDAKFPRETYERLLQAGERGEADQVRFLRRQLESEVRGFAKTVSQKYIVPPATTDYALLFLPTEGLFCEVISLPGLTEQLYRDYKIQVTGPANLAAYLSMIQMGARTIDIERKSGDVWRTLGAVKTEFERYSKTVETLSGHLNKAVNSVEALGTRSRMMIKALKNVDAVPEGAAVSMLIDAELDDAGHEQPPAALLLSDNAA